MSVITEPRWQHMRGGIRHEQIEGVDHTIFYLLVSAPDKEPWGQRVAVPSDRLRAWPHLYRQTLDWMVRDISARLS